MFDEMIIREGSVRNVVADDGTVTGFSFATHMPYYRGLGWQPGDFPHAEAYYARCLSLPMFPTLTDEQQQYVIGCIREVIGQ